MRTTQLMVQQERKRLRSDSSENDPCASPEQVYNRTSLVALINRVTICLFTLLQRHHNAFASECG
jgi:hypothetical protein